MNPTFVAPFTAIHLAYAGAFSIGVENTLRSIESSLAAPVQAMVLLWFIIQGIFLMRGSVDGRQLITKAAMVTIIVGLVLRGDLYEQYVTTLFEYTLPNYVKSVSGAGLPIETIPSQLDAIFVLCQQLFQRVAIEIGPMNQQDTMAFEGAQITFFMSLWGIFGVFDLTLIMTTVLVAIGPMILVGYLFDFTREITAKWVSQLISYGLLLLLISIVATIVVATELAGVATYTVLVLALKPTAAKLLGLYELDMFLMTGNALVIVLPGLAGAIGGGYITEGTNFVQSFGRRLARGRGG